MKHLGAAATRFSNQTGPSVVYNNGNSGAGTVTIDFNKGNVQKVTMTGNCTFAFSNPIAGVRYLLELVEDATGSRIPVWPGTVKWSGGVAIGTLSGANKIDLLALYYNGTSYLISYAVNF